MSDHDQTAALARLADRREHAGAGHSGPPSPPPPVDHGETRVTEQPDETVARHGLPRHPTPKVLARHLRDVADALETHGRAALDMAPLLAARGWPSGGAGGGKVSGGGATIRVLNEEGDEELVSVTSTEAAAMAYDRWRGADRELAGRLRALFTAAARAHQYVADLVVHADDVDPLPAGTGECQACTIFCRPTKTRPNFRLKGGLCPAHYQAWRRSGVLKDEFLREHRKNPDAGGGDEPSERVGCGQGHRCCDLTATHTHWHKPPYCPACKAAKALDELEVEAS